MWNHKSLEDDIEESRGYFGFEDEFLDTTPKTRSMKERHWISLKTKNKNKTKKILLCEIHG